MRFYFIILITIVSSCKAQKSVAVIKQIDTIQYYSDECNRYLNYEREKLNDSVYVERHGDVSDTLMLKGSSLFLLHRDIKYKLIDAITDFNYKGKFNYYYYGLSSKDTLKNENESDTQFKLRLYQSIVIYVPIKTTFVKDKKAYVYYILQDCYPITETCIKSKIANGQYGIIYFEKDIGYVGHSAADAKCNYIITNKSYSLLSAK